MGMSITDEGPKEGSGCSRSNADVPQAVEAVQSSCDKITTHARRVGVKSE